MATFLVAMFFTALTFGQGNLTISFHHFVGERKLQLDTATYYNEFDQSFTVTKFKYYIGKIGLIKANGSIVKSGDYFLVNEEDSASKKIILKDLPTGEYSGINFIIGVDSIDNCSGPQSGALDPVNAMFWAWNTGYIFLKLEGKSSASKSPGNVFEYHIGGYRPPSNCIRQVSFNFSKPLKIDGAGKSVLDLKADILEILRTPSAIDFSKLSSVTDFHNTTMIADNYMDMFSVLEIHNEE
jgi:hypothetical protein